MKTKEKYSLFDLVGLLTKEEAEDMKKHIKELNERMRKGIEERLKK